MTTAAAFMSRDAYYAEEAVKQHDAFYRDPVVTPGDHGRADVASGPMAKWMRFNRAQDLLWIDDAEGKPRAVTRKQAEVLELALSIAEKKLMTMREMAEVLHVAPSTVSRTLTKLSAWGLIGYIVGRGRWAGLVIIRRRPNDRFDHLRKAAIARIRGWRKAAEARVSRLKVNVASCYPWKVIEDHGYDYVYVDVMGATLKAPFTQDDMDELDRDLGLA